jgi:putative hydrolase of the HAD superfamily
MIKGILFDLDNTLIDFMKMKRMACAEAASAMVGAGLKGDTQQIQTELFEFYMDYGIEGDRPYNEFLKKRDAFSEVILAAAINAYLRVKNAFLEPYPGVIPTFVQLIKRGIALGAITDAPSLKGLRRIDAIKLQGFFDVVITEAGKPKPDGFLKAADHLKLSPDQLMMVGDWPEKDMVGAKGAGLKTCFAKYGHTVGDASLITPDFVINQIEDLLTLKL